MKPDIDLVIEVYPMSTIYKQYLSVQKPFKFNILTTLEDKC